MSQQGYSKVSGKRKSGAEDPPLSQELRRLGQVAAKEAARQQHEAEFNDTSDFSPGQILGVDLTDFQVCARGSYRFKPWLNLIVGPNGSGKSTVVTALFLLLNGDQDDTGRKSKNDFIRIGCKMARATAWMLDADRKIRKISLFLERTQPPVYEIDGRPGSIAHIEKLNEELNIQVNNRCQFLPQERVATFSAESSHQRLISTLNSVGQSGMVRDLSKLIEFGENIREQAGSADQNTNEIETLTAEKERLTATVERLKQTYEEKKELEVLNSVKLLTKYREAKQNYDDVAAQLEDAKSQEREFHQNNSRLFGNRSIFEELKKESSRATLAITQDIDAASHRLHITSCALKKESLESTTADVDALEYDMEQSEANLRTMKGVIKTKNSELTGFREKLDQQLLHDAQTRMTDLQEAISSLETEKEHITISLSNKERSISNLQEKRKDASKRKSHETEERMKLFQKPEIIRNACKLISQNKHLFTAKVHPPPLLTMKIKPGAEAQVSVAMPLSSLEFFLCTNYDDFSAVSNLFDQNNINLRIVTSTARFQPNATLRSKLIELGFDGVISDLIEDHPAIWNYIVSNAHLDTVPYTTKESLPDSAEKGVRQLHGFPVQRYLYAAHMIQLNKSKYGRKQVSETRKALGGNHGWVSKLAKSSAESAQAIEKEIEEYDTGIASIRSEINTDNSKLEKINTTRLEKIQERAPFANTVKKQRTLQNMIIDGEKYLSLIEKKYKEAEDASQLFLERELEISMASGDKFNSTHSEAVYADPREITLLVNSLDAQQVQQEECKSSIRRLNYEIDGQLGTIKNLIEQLTRTSQNARTQVEEYRPEINGLKERLGDDGYNEAFEKSVGMTSDEVEREVANIEASLALNEDGQTYEEGVQLLEQTTTRLDALVNQRTQANSRLTEAQDQLNCIAPEFESQSRRFVEGISEKYFQFFSRLGCTGQVDLQSPPLRFEDWGIEIKVSYRDGEPVRALSAKTQSGGEKAVATAVYLMALQGYSKAPFFVVDEINQGMDKINETAIHKFIVETACIFNPRQYFMVTPKLLPDLTYHPRVKIICHNSSVNVSKRFRSD